MLFDIGDAKEGMVVNEDITLPGTKIVLISRGNRLNERMIVQLYKWNIEKLDIKTDEDEEDKVPDDEMTRLQEMSKVENDTLILTGDVQLKKNEIQFANQIKVDGNVLPGTTIRSDKDILITGKVKGSNIFSKGNILIMHGIEGTGQCQIEAEGDVKSAFINDCEVNSKKGSVYVDFEINRSRIKVKKSLLVGIHESMVMLNEEFTRLKKGAVNSGTVIVGKELETNDLGSEEKERLEVQVVNFEIRQMGEELIKIEKNLKEKLLEFRHIDKFIKLINVLGKNITELPDHKKQELKEKSDRYFQLKNDIQELNTRRRKLSSMREQEMEGIRKRAYIKVHNKVFPGVTVSIDQLKLDVKQTSKKVAFYKRGMIIMAKLEEDT